jgi:hypothetical protein
VSDLDHVKNVMALLALLQDSHTGVLWFGWESGRFALRGIMDGHALATTLPLGSVLRPRTRLETARCRPRDGPRYDHE